MADLRQVEVVFKTEVSSESQKPSEKIKKGTKNKVQTQQTDYVGSVVVNQAWNIVKQSTSKIVNYEINKWFTLKDDYIGQRNLNNALATINKASSSITAIAGGFVAGGVIGGAVATVGVVVASAISIAQHIDKQNIELDQLDAQLQYQRQRAGYSLTSGRVGENR